MVGKRQTMSFGFRNRWVAAISLFLLLLLTFACGGEENPDSNPEIPFDENDPEEFLFDEEDPEISFVDPQKLVNVISDTQDTTPPNLVEFDYTPKTVDVSNGDQYVTFTMRLTDDLSGVYAASWILKSPSGQQTSSGTVYSYSRISGDALDGVYRGNAIFRQYSEAGIWHIILCMHDKISNWKCLSEADLKARGFPTEVEAISISDLAPPNLAEFDYSPKAIDVSTGDQAVTFTMRLTDDVSGVYAASWTLESPSGQQRTSGHVYSSSRISGNALDGVYRGNVIFLQYSEAGIWRTSYLCVYDNVSHRVCLYETDLKARGFPTEIEVTGISDVVPPNVAEFDYSPKTIDVTYAPQTITFNLRLTDDLSGIMNARVYLRKLYDYYSSYYKYVSSPITGNALDGVYEVSFNFPQDSKMMGTWYVDSLYVRDKAGNYISLRESDLKTRGFSTKMEVTKSDVSPPNLVEFDYTPKTINVSSGDQAVTFTMRLTDDLSGFYYNYSSLKSPSGKQSINWNGSYRISGTALDGVYQSKVTFPRYSEAGTWRVNYLCMYDEAKNARCLYEADLKARGFITETQVVQCSSTGLELCGDKIDNDCDGQTDEGFDVGSVCSVGTGACQASGEKICASDGTTTKCNAVAGAPTTELCGDGIDNDCDGPVDEGFDTGSTCSVGIGGCQASGEKVCTTDKLATICNATAGTPVTELCNDGIDNDCDGLTDEGDHGESRCKSPAEAKNSTPVADAGPDTPCDGIDDIVEGGIITLAGTCTDADAIDLLTGTWTQNGGGTVCGSFEGGPATGGSPLTVTAGCAAPDVPANENESFRLECHDGIVGTTDSVAICVNAKPSAIAQSVSTKEDTAVTTTLKGSDPNNETLSYTVHTTPTYGTLSGIPPDLTYTPIVNYHGTDSLVFSVSDGLQSSDPATVSISVGSVNDIPVACAGSDQTVTPPATVTLDGTCSTDPDGDSLTFRWTQTSGETVSLSDATASRPTFTPTKAGTYTFQLTVHDGTIGSNPDSVNITVNNVDPVADPGGDQSLYPGGSIALVCHGTDANKDPLSYFWTQQSGPTLTTEFPVKTSELTVTAPTVQAESAVRLSCTVSDGVGGYGSDSVTVTIHPPEKIEEPAPTVVTASNEETFPIQEQIPVVIVEGPNGTSITPLDDGRVPLTSTVSDSQETVNASWEVVSGPDTLQFDGNTIDTANEIYKSGTYQIREKVIDETGVHYSEPVTVTMPNNPPLLEEVAFGGEADVSPSSSEKKQSFTYDSYSNVISLRSVFSDRDDDQLTYRWSTTDEGQELITTGTGEVTLWNRKAGTSKIVVTVEDGQGGKTREIIEIYVPPPKLTDEDVALSIAGPEATGADKQVVRGRIRSPVIPIIRVNGVMAEVTQVESASGSLHTGIMALTTDPTTFDTYSFTAVTVPVGTNVGSLGVDILTDVDGEEVPLFSKSVVTGAGDGGTENRDPSPAASGGCSLVQ